MQLGHVARAVVRSSVVPAPLDAVWAHASTMEGVKHELGPWVRMTVPRRACGGRLEDVPLGEVAFRSVLLAGSALPFDVHSLRLVARDVPHRFLERSTSLLQRRWEHERTSVAEGPDATRVTDRLTVEPRVPGAGWLVERIAGALFSHRHRRLGATPQPSSPTSDDPGRGGACTSA
ncbi:MAG TPA: hypothetical protein RMH99_11235 [Sandaracinaceae bacterium LLY-WYZ-13_1]|nr:hypothetical protein [Sandaracinaceae bacterium LLY-WYZ-13_1]